MKRTIGLVLTALVLMSALAGCGFVGSAGNGTTSTDMPAASASPAVMTPDMDDGIVRDNDGVITDDDTGTGTPRTDAGRTGAGANGGMNGNSTGTSGTTGTNGANGTTGTTGRTGTNGTTGGTAGTTTPADNG